MTSQQTMIPKIFRTPQAFDCPTKHTLKFSLFVIAFLILLPSTLFAQTFDTGVRSASMGGAATATSRASDAIINNSAAIAGSAAYSIEGAYLYRKNSHVISASIVDSKTNPSISAGVGYSYMLGVNDLDGMSGHDIRFGVAVPAIQNRLSLGIGGRYTWLFQDVTSQGEKSKIEIVKGFTLNAGVLLRIVDTLTFGFSGLNLIPQCKKEICKSFMPMTFKTGLGYAIAGLTLGVDVDFDIDQGSPAIDAGVGAEYVIIDMIPVRIGYRYLGVNQGNLITTGLGFQSTVADVNVSYQVDVSHKQSHTVFANIVLKL